MAIKTSRTYPLKIAANSADSLDVTGEFYYVLECDQPSFLIGIDGGTPDFAKFRTKRQLPDGDNFETIQFENPNGVDLNIKVVVGYGSYGDDEVNIGGSVALAMTTDGANSAVPLLLAAVEVAPANLTRKKITIQNMGTSEVSIGFNNAVTVANGGVLAKSPDGLAPGGSYSTKTYTGAFWAISATTGMDIRVLEEG